ncbi:hypothetical protein [Oceanicella actignis]|uniref:Uncharacterized protein n=1 Tax=Oceanicella actignis TaxID=1189325 RepID=A0A1M7TNS3_9RHOB|nr:hypothetical protein [Oceanicella actignis]SET72874.1 hypothetical protein SAMN04488119_10872 [Oceanicella actignis]SHN72340.1 hypothetical protein SAMN05216200_10873 [Oceanicella actignis]
MILRLGGLLLIGLAATLAALDLTEKGGGTGRGAFRSLGEFWFAVHRESLIGLQSGIENRADPAIWAAIEPALHLPAAPVLGAAGVVLLALGMALKIRRAHKRARRI